MIDVHIIPTVGFEQNYADMVAQLEAHPKIIVQTGEFIQDNLLEARWLAYNKGTAPYVSWVDGDDAILDLSWVDRALGILDRNPHVSCVYPRWRTLREDGVIKESPIHVWSPEHHSHFTYAPLPHHLSIMRRENVLELLKLARENVSGMIKNPERYVLSGLIRYGQLLSFNDMAYEWRLRDGTARSKEDPADVIKWVRHQASIDSRIAKSFVMKDLV